MHVSVSMSEAVDRAMTPVVEAITNHGLGLVIMPAD